MDYDNAWFDEPESDNMCSICGEFYSILHSLNCRDPHTEQDAVLDLNEKGEKE